MPDQRFSAAPPPAPALEDMPYEPVGHYAAIGNCRSIALVSRNGSIDWLCLPHFSSPSIFAALVDRRRGGRFAVRPRGIVEVERVYDGDSAVLQTRFRCAGGVLRLTDAMTMLSEEEARSELHPQHEIVRIAECLAGEVDVDVLFQPRPDYGQRAASLQRRGALGWLCADRGMALYLYGELDFAPVGIEGEAALRAGARLRAGEACRLVLAYSENDVAALAPLHDAAARVRDSRDWWQGWLARCSYAGPYRRMVARSCLALKLLTYRLSGAIVAAATTSLPVDDTGERNWDYRYCWLRDTSMLLQSFMDLGFRDESNAFFGWLLHATQLTRPHLQILYDVHGETALRERIVAGFEGHAGKGPVRLGNAAMEQRQLDIWGEVALTARRFVEHGGCLDASERELLAGFGKAVCRCWRQPDHGIWEIRLPPRHNTHTKLMCWLTLDCLLKLKARLELDIDEVVLRRERARIREDIEMHAFDAALGSYVGYYGATEPDASLLLLARYGFIAADDPRMRGTWRLIERRLARDGLLYRYPPNVGYDGVGGADGFFVICSYWQVDYLARLGELERAKALFERLAGLANDVGLYAEQVDESRRALTGNFPQAFSHVGLITAALAIEQAEKGRRGEGIEA